MSLGDVLVQKGKISSDQLEAARAAKGSSDEPIEKALVRLGFIGEQAVLEIMGEQLSLPLVDLTTVNIDPELLKRVPA